MPPPESTRPATAPPSKHDARSEPNVRVTAKGRRYVDSNEMFDDPTVRARLKKAEEIAISLGIKGRE